MRFRDDNPADLDRARTAVAAWREQNPAGTQEQLIAALGHQFHRDYAVVLRACCSRPTSTRPGTSPESTPARPERSGEQACHGGRPSNTIAVLGGKAPARA